MQKLVYLNSYFGSEGINLENSKKNIARILLAEDFSAVGQLSLTAAMPLLNAFQVPLAVLPTELLSTQSEGFGMPFKLSTVAWARAALQHWQTTGIKLTGALIGYFADQRFGELLLNEIQLAGKLTLLDPVMADNGRFYPTLTKSHITILQKLLPKSLICTPNLTEACFLLDQPYIPHPTFKQLVSWLNQLESSQPAGGKTVITGITVAGKTGCVWLEDGQLRQVLYPSLPGHFYGSGDVFAALLFGLLWQGLSWSQAVIQATGFLHDSLAQQVSLPTSQRRYGIELSSLLVQIETFLAKKADKRSN